MEVGHALRGGIQRLDRAPHEVEQHGIRLALLHKAVEHLGHEQRYGRLLHVEGYRLQHDAGMHLAQTVHLHLRGLQPLELQSEHRLEQGLP